MNIDRTKFLSFLNYKKQFLFSSDKVNQIRKGIFLDFERVLEKQFKIVIQTFLLVFFAKEQFDIIHIVIHSIHYHIGFPPENRLEYCIFFAYKQYITHVKYFFLERFNVRIFLLCPKTPNKELWPIQYHGTPLYNLKVTIEESLIHEMELSIKHELGEERTEKTYTAVDLFR